MVKFDQIHCILHPQNLKYMKMLSTDQQYWYRICLSIKYGTYSSSVNDNSTGKLSHAKQLAMTNRLLLFYIGLQDHLIILGKYVMLVYASLWFEIKMNSNCQYGAQHFGKMISLARQLSYNEANQLQSILKQCIFLRILNTCY